MKRFLLVIAIITGLYIFGLGFLFVFQEKLIFHPKSLEQSHKFHFQSSFTEGNLINPIDSAQINYLWFRVKEQNPKGVILYFHGNADNLQRWGQVADDFREFGYDAFVMDYRGFGKSKGVMSEAAMHEDAKLCYDFLLQHYSSSQIIIYGRSIGTGVATRLASENQARKLILETPYYNLADVVSWYGIPIPFPGLLKYHFRSNEYIKKVNYPIYIFHGTEDKVVPFKSGKKLSRLLSCGDCFIVIEGGEHNNLNSYAEYHIKLKEILE